ncbi:hypothetical protein BC939DRAFT_407851 [Gamsiella multidivaricata]|uniref:uncharacterized protein n=1 Tax=Gamsiella multidivaricata TaxID=101098 RepID=UPI00221F29DF|nr:uncharacterized protein BC939DRAFT_407851 [Gamsiella multidivaricata]KAI7828906.1 hypothetical protein BC939DRAFT_407851 [Gamsiella multidivaricata]
MFLDWIAQLGLLEHDPVSNVLARFPLSVKKTLITEVTSTLLVTSDLSLLSSMAHMNWAMEVLGQGFALPLEELSIAQETTQLYSQWLFEPQMRPLAFRQAAGTADEQLLYQTIFHHYSLLFQIRSTSPPAPGINHLHHHSHHNHHHRHPTTPLASAQSTSYSHQASHSTAAPQVPVGVLIQRHIELCKKVLTVLTMAGRQLGNLFSEGTWEVLLKVVLGITDSLLREQPSKSATSPASLIPEKSKMSDDLCEHLLRVLFELWLRSNIRQVHMWDILKQCFNGWTYRIPVLHQWAATSLGLCQRVVRLLYGPGQGTDVVNLAVGGYNIGLDLQADFTLYAWHRVIYLLRCPAKLTPANCLAAVNGIGRMVETFLIVGSSNNQTTIPGSPPLPSTPTDIFSSSPLSYSNHPNSSNANHKSTNSSSFPSKPTSPDGNTIMHMFGAWLFEVSALPTPEPTSAAYSSHWHTFDPYYPTDSYHEAQASAFGVLCRIFSKPQPSARPFLRIYTERFYEALSIGLRSETSLPTILAHSAELFTSELEGVRMMVPDFVIGIRMAMGGQIRVANGYMSQEKQKQVFEDLHLAALKVAGCIMCLPNHFEKVELKEGWNLGLSKSANMALDGKGGREDKEILAQLIRVLYTTDTPAEGSIPASERFTTLKYYILEMLLNCLETETSSFNLRYLLHLIEVYVHEDVAFCPGLVGVVVKTIQEKIVTIQVPVDVALCAFDVLIGCAKLYEYVRRDSKSCARELVLALCRYVDALLANHAVLTSTHPLVVRAYECMLHWILAGQWIVGDQDCHLAVISSISSGLHIAERVEEQEASIVPPKPPQEKRRWGGGAAGNAMISAVGAPLSLGKPSSNSAVKLFQVNNKHPGPIKILNQESRRDKENRKNRSASSSISGHVKASRLDLTAIQHAAEMAMIQFSNQLANFPIWTDDIGPSRMSTLWNDIKMNRTSLISPRGLFGFEPLEHQQQRQHHPPNSPVADITGPARYFLLDRRIILGCCELSSIPSSDSDAQSFVDERGPFVVVTMRDSSGKNSWKVRPSHFERNYANAEPKTFAQNGNRVAVQEADEHTNNRTVPGLEEDGYVADPIARPRVLTVEAADESSIGLRRYVRPAKCTAEESSSESPLADEKSSTPQMLAFEPGETEFDRPSQQLVQASGSNVLRILMAQMGYLSLESRSRIMPLRLSERLLAELQFLDDLKERDCLGVSVFFAQSGDVGYDELIHGSPTGISKDFTRFLDCLGWPIQVETHSGYLGRLNKDLCHTTPYFADRNSEVIFHVPYLMRPSSPDVTPMHDHRLVDQFRSVTVQDYVAIVWVEERERMLNLIPLIDQSAMIFILIHPLEADSAGGLFWIRIVIHAAHTTAGSVRLAANPLIIGPLADGMLVSRHSLGSLVRNTAISADKACRVMTDSYTEPSAVRARYIQEVLQMHQPDEPESISEFYRTMFAA